MSPGRADRGAPGVIVTCEHASNLLPARYGTLRLSADKLRSHIAWDEGAKEAAQALAKALGAPLIEGRWSRLLIDLNRSLHHRRVIPPIAFGWSVPGNQNISPADRERRVQDYYAPFRKAVRDAVDHAVAERGRCLHLGVHTFVPELDGKRRTSDIGLLYDPRRKWEVRVVDRIIPALSAAGLRVRRNHPYRGVADGHTTGLRRLYPNAKYAGIEIEINQALLPEWKHTIARLLALVPAVTPRESPRSTTSKPARTRNRASESDASSPKPQTRKAKPKSPKA